MKEEYEGLDQWQKWIDARPKNTEYLLLSMRCLLDNLSLDQTRRLTSWCLGVERTEADEQEGAE